MRVESPEVKSVLVHGHRRAYVTAGSGPVVLLIHGLGCDHATWDPLIERLSRNHTVIAPDLLGHGASDKPRADYSVGGYANGMRDLMSVLGVERATVVGHSLGGGIAMQFAYQYPQLVERLVLIAPGGFGPEVTPALRAVTLPGFHQAMGVLTLPGVRHVGMVGLRALALTGFARTRDLGEVARIFDSLRDPKARTTMSHVARAVVDWRGQVITMRDRAYLTESVPICIIWGQDDQVLPAAHAARASTVLPHAQIEVISNAGHFPHRDHPDRCAKIIRDFVQRTPAAEFVASDWQSSLRRGADTAAVAETNEAGLTA